MTCNHVQVPLPHTTYMWCKQCGSVQDSYNGHTWVPRMYDLVRIEQVELTEEEKSECQRGNKIMAIKLLRDRTYLGLKDSKDIIDAYLEKNPPKVDPWGHIIRNYKDHPRPFGYEEDPGMS